jgi:hypothetical protein
MITLDIFNQDAFSTTELTDFIKRQDFIPSTLRDMSLFQPQPIRTTDFWVELKNGEIALIPTSERGAPRFENAKQKRSAVSFQTVRLLKGDTITASELQNIRAEGEAEKLKEVQSEVTDRFDTIAGDMDLTEENLFLGAIQGILVDADGVTVLENFFTKFGITQATEVDFDLDNATPASGALLKVCTGIQRAMQRAGKGAFLPTTEIVAFVGDAFWDDLVAHPEVKGAYNNWVASAAFSNDKKAFGEFYWGGIYWKNYRGTDDNSTVSIATDEAKFFPRGARKVFKVAYSPAETFEFVNTRGMARYARVIPDLVRNEKADVELSSYLLPYCARPEMLLSGRRT